MTGFGDKIMQINNPFQMNDWEIRKFLKVILAIQLATWGVIGLDALGLQIPILRQFIGFIYLTFIPGIIILRVLKLHKLGNVETLLYTVGLSIVTLMFTGLFMNTIYPLFGVSGPISITPLIITISIIVLVLCILSYVRDKDFSDPNYIDIKDVFSPPALFLCLIPFLSIFGTYLVNFHHSNILLLFLIIIIALIVLLIGFDKFIPKNLYPVAVFVIAISILFHRWLISMYLTGWDVNVEYHLSNLVKMNGIWDSTMYGTCNAMLSVVMLPTIYSIISNMDLTWVFKVIDPLLFSLVPLGLYRIFQKQADDKIAFLSCFFFMSFLGFYSISPGRQWIAELFLVLLITAMIDKDMNKIKQSFLFIVFGVSLVVSHYGTSYIYMFCLISAWLILASMNRPAMQRLGDDIHSKFSRTREKLALVGNPISLKIEDITIHSTFVLLFITFALSWYMYVSSSSAFDTIVHIGDHIASSIYTDFLNPEAVEGLQMMLAKPQPGLLHEVNRVINYLNQIFIIIGGIVLLLKYRELKFERDYVAFSMINLAILFACISLPFFASSLNMDRVYHITLIFLAPFCVIGGITVLRLLSRIVKVSWTNKSLRTSLKVLSVYFVIFMLYQTGFVYEVMEGHSGSISLSQGWIKEYGDTRDKAILYAAYYPDQDIFGVKWISKNRNNESQIHADEWHRDLVFWSYGMMPDEYVLTNTTKVKESSYIYLGYPNVRYGFMYGSDWLQYWNITDISPLLDECGRIYSNGGAQVYYR